jgi:hypothetical protein
MHKKCQHPLNKFAPEVPDVKQVSNGPKIDYQGTCVPYQNLYIYYIEGPLSREEEPLTSWEIGLRKAALFYFSPVQLRGLCKG